MSYQSNRLRKITTATVTALPEEIAFDNGECHSNFLLWVFEMAALNRNSSLRERVDNGYLKGLLPINNNLVPRKSGSRSREFAILI